MQRKKRLKRRTSLKRMKAVIKETQADLSVVKDLGPQDLRDHRDQMDHQDLMDLQELIDLQDLTFEISQRY